VKLPRLLAGKRRHVFARLVVNGMAQAAAALAVAGLLRHAFDDVLAGAAPGIRGELWLTLGAVAFAVGITAALRRREHIDGEILAQSYAHRLRRAMYARLYATVPFELQRLSRGAVLLRFLSDLTAITQWIGQGFARLLVAGVSAAGALTSLAFIQWQLALAVAAVLTAGIGATLYVGRSFDSAVRTARERRTYLASNIAEKVSTLAVVQAFGQAGREKKRLRRQSGRLRGALIARARPAGSMTAVAEATAALAVVAALGCGVLAIAAGITTPGTVIAFAAIAGMLAAPVRDLGRAYEYWLRAGISREKLITFLAGAERARHARRGELPPGPGRLELRGLGWGDVLREAAAEAAPRGRIAVTGGAGAGKSALLYLASGLLAPDSGQVILDGQDLGKTTPESVRRAIGLVSPDLPLLRGSVDDNLRYGAPDASTDALARLESLCEMDAILGQLPAGRDTRVTEGGRNLSLGQRQRIALIRALLGEPRVMLLDDVDLALDPALKRVLLRIIERYKGTILMVTRDPDLLARSTAVWELGDGKLRIAPGPALIAEAAPDNQSGVAFI
jgi:ABC-type multidrug transport system fused ATPase/permease subunit